MVNDASLFSPVLNRGERLLWVGRPSRWVLCAQGIPFLLLGLMWGAMDLFFIGGVGTRGESDRIGFVMIPFFLLHMMPCWLGIGNMFRLILAGRNAAYAVTDRRLILRSGVFGASFKTLDLTQIEHMEVKINPLERLLGAGSIFFNAASLLPRGVSLPAFLGEGFRFVGIRQPYALFRAMQEITADPNAEWYLPPEGLDLEKASQGSI